MKEHSGHQFDDLEEKYAKKFAFCQNEISKIKKYFLSTTLDFKIKINVDVIESKESMEGIRNSIKAEAESLKELLDKVTSDKLEQVNTIEDTLNKSLKSQETINDDYIAYLDKVLFSEDFENLKIQSIPETTQPVLPLCTTGQFCRDDVSQVAHHY